MTIVYSEIAVNAPLAQAYRAFTNATALRNWLCDVASVTPRPHGRMYLWWNGDFYSSGHYLALEENRSISFQWFSSIDPAATQVEVNLTEQAGAVLVRLAHTVPDEPQWEQKAEIFRQNWDASLPNLKSVLETGIDLRLANRPMLGVIPGDFTAEQAARLGVPVKEGFRLDGVVEGMGAAGAGLQKDDVIIGIDGKPIDNEFNTFLSAIAGKRGGDVIQVDYYRGPQKNITNMELTRRPMPEVPFDAVALAGLAQEKYTAALKELEKCFAGVSNDQVSRRPASHEWSALEVLAHLLHAERNSQFFITDLVGGQERWADDFGGNIDAHVRATASVYPELAEMLAELRRSIQETLALVANLPAEFVADKGSYYRVGSLVLQGDNHIYTHIPQIQAALQSGS